ncbi:MAG: glycosyltransferase family 4 protein [Thermoplasmata archaeon]|nr:MAG: glycosyltransferase family 4 protein [Thermoplasmata archaeon]
MEIKASFFYLRIFWKLKKRRGGDKLTKKKICMPVYSYYPFDPRVRRAAESLVEMGHSVDIICLKGEGEDYAETFKGVNIYRLPLEHRRGGYLRYLYNYSMFFFLSFFMLNSLDRKNRYNAMHIHSLPDFLVFIAFFQKRRGIKIILDLHEAMPEIFAARFNRDMDSFLVKFPIFLEKISHAFATQIITVNDTIKDIYMRRGVPEKKIIVIMNSPDEKLRLNIDLEEFKAKLGLDDKFLLVFVGGINYERNIEVILEAIARVKSQIPNLYFILFGHMYGHKGASYKEHLKSLVKQNGLDNNVYIGGKLNPEEVSSYLDLTDFGVVSYIRNPLTDVAVPNKVFEYIALNKPIIVCRLGALQSLLGDDTAIYYEPEDADDLAAKILWLHRHKNELKPMIENSQKVYERCKWDVMKKRLQKMYED